MTSPVPIAQRLVRFDTSGPNGEVAACVRWIGELLRGAGIQTRLLAADPRRPNLVARLPGLGLEPPLLLHAHIDVVPAPSQGWSRPPFGGEIAGGELWGRGAVDMKGHLAMMLAALLRLRARGEPPAGDVILAVVCDEETGSDAGARFLVDRHPELFTGVRYAIGEDGGPELGLGHLVRLHPIVVAEKRTCWIRATLRGPAGHASRVAGADGAVHKLNRLLTALADGGLGPRLTPVVDLLLRALAAALPHPLGARVAAFRADPARAHVLRDLGDTAVRYLRSLVQHTVSTTVVSGGTATNVHPAEITVELDGRVLPGDFSTDEFLAELRTRIGFPVDLDLFVEGEPTPPPQLDGFYDRLAGIVRDRDPGGVPLPAVTTASTDARLFSQLGIRCFGWLPLKHDSDVAYRGLLHCPDERIAVPALEFGADCFHALLSGQAHAAGRLSSMSGDHVGNIQLSRVATIAEINPDEWRPLAEPVRLYQSHPWLRWAEEYYRLPTTYVLARDAGGTLVGAASTYLMREVPRALTMWYDPVHMFLRPHGDPGDAWRRWFPVLLIGGCSGYHSEILLGSGLDPAGREAVAGALMAECRTVAAEVGARSIAFIYAPKAAAEGLGRHLGDSTRVIPTSAEAVIDLGTGIEDFEGYLARFPSARRSKLRKEVAAFEAVGARVRSYRMAEVLDHMIPLQGGHQRKYGDPITDESIGQLLRLQEAHLGEASTVFVEERDGRINGFVLCFTHGGKLYARSAGFHPERAAPYAYFNLAVYAPVRHAIAHGLSEVVLGAGSFQAKRLRGAEIRALWSAVVPPEPVEPDWAAALAKPGRQAADAGIA